MAAAQAAPAQAGPGADPDPPSAPAHGGTDLHSGIPADAPADQDPGAIPDTKLATGHHTSVCAAHVAARSACPSGDCDASASVCDAAPGADWCAAPGSQLV